MDDSPANESDDSSPPEDTGQGCNQQQKSNSDFSPVEINPCAYVQLLSADGIRIPAFRIHGQPAIRQDLMLGNVVKDREIPPFQNFVLIP